MNIHVIRADGAEEHVQGTTRDIATLIHAKICDVINLRDGRVMFVDDQGYETTLVRHSLNRYELKPIGALKPVNQKATQLYHGVCVPGTTHAIVGDVAIVVDAEA